MMSLQLLINIVTIWPRIATVGEFLLSEQTRSQPPLFFPFVFFVSQMRARFFHFVEQTKHSTHHSPYLPERFGRWA
jgi:hypothetical protein